MNGCQPASQPFFRERQVLVKVLNPEDLERTRVGNTSGKSHL